MGTEQVERQEFEPTDPYAPPWVIHGSNPLRGGRRKKSIARSGSLVDVSKISSLRTPPAGKSKKKAAPKNRAWFERKVAELKGELEKLPTDRQEQLTKDLDAGEEH